MLPRIRRPEVVEAADAKPHLPVTMPVAIQECPVMLRRIQEAKEMPTTVKAGCSRFPCNWSVVREQIGHIESDTDLGSAWLQVVNTIELEIAGRHDIVGDRVLRYLTPPSVDVELAAFKGAPEDRRESGHGCVYAWRVAARWARHIRRMSEYMDTLIHLICNVGISASVEKE
eukprot:398175-Pyramimonas_sp.AAC.1